MAEKEKIQHALFQYCLRLADNSLILGHRLSEWCGHGPVLEEDIALTNIALDHIGHARALLQYAAQVEGKNRTEDDLAFLRKEHEFYNTMLAEQLNGDFGKTIVRQFFTDVFDFYFYQELSKSSDEMLAAIAAKSFKEMTYHLRHSSEWVIRLGDGTEESHQRIQKSVNDLWMFTGEFFEMNEVDEILLKEKIAVDLSKVKSLWEKKVFEVLKTATLVKPESTWMQTGSRKGFHTEHLGFLLAEMQYLPRAYPDAKW
ncbi:MAG: 1,2-phenylacetyl-CoA epoxidase subunit PaaC [Bacteroidia bacterium]